MPNAVIHSHFEKKRKRKSNTTENRRQIWTVMRFKRSCAVSVEWKEMHFKRLSEIVALLQSQVGAPIHALKITGANREQHNETEKNGSRMSNSF